jgi:hypothetical protein
MSSTEEKPVVPLTVLLPRDLRSQLEQSAAQHERSAGAE